MDQATKLIVQAEMSDGLLAVVEDFLNKGVYHVYKNDKNVQPNHDALGVMRYLAVVLHAQDYRATNAEMLLEQERAKVKLLEEMVANYKAIDGNAVLATQCGQWEMKRTMIGEILYGAQDSDAWITANSMREVFDHFYKEIK